MRPVIRALERRGAQVLVTARDFAQTLGLCDRLGIEHEAIGHHRGGRLAAKGAGLASRSLALAGWAKGRRFDAALGHGSNDITLAAKLLGIPSATTFDYEWAKVQHSINCRLARRVVVPDAIPPERLARYGATTRKLRRYPGLKEEYYLADFVPGRGGARRARARPRGADRRRPHPAGRVALPPLRAPAVRAAARAAARAGAGRRAAAHGRAARRAGDRRRLRRARACGRRAVARRPRGPRRLRRRDDEPRGGRARHTGLDDVRGPPRRCRRAARSPRAGCAASRAPRTSRWSSAARTIRGPSACAAIPSSSPTCWSTA